VLVSVLSVEGAAYLTLGLLAGFLGGLLGIGGGFVLVPGLYYVFHEFARFPGYDLQMALGTTMASILFTAASSVRANAKRGVVRSDVVRRFALFVAAGSAFGAYLATTLDTSWVKFGFAAFCLYSASRMLFFAQPQPSAERTVENSRLELPGLFFGTICGLIGVGGANLFVPFLLKRNLDLRHAIASGAALQIPIAIAGSVGYVALGWGVIDAPGTFGFITWPALSIVVIASVATAPLGVACSHSMPIPTLKKLFGGVTALIGLKMSGAFTLIALWIHG